MNPKDVNPSNFKVKNILFDNGEFSIAYGIWEDGTNRIAMRWNGENDDPGYPKLFKNPVWFLVHDSLKTPILKSLIGIPNSEFQSIVDTLKTEI